MAAAVGCGSASGSWARFGCSSRRNVRNNGFRVSCASSAVKDPYKILKIRHGASESEIKKAFRKLALQYHPDVCKESNSGAKFNQIYEAYDLVMSNLNRESTPKKKTKTYENKDVETEFTFRGMHDPEWELWEEWMGWEGAGIRDYSSHINPYI
ncbi:hypothetical protein CDL12_23102 [Handroanthus impetiginosus]|uniref:J domain-containing protein n=1 Tax=Handroanthus impetiginosus TaxID=429701 RepID=A0A2G9GGE6_9LAMI|nr:hypothetical protein CDL12_23102 [Handroanthus impetiginosus]